MTLCLSPYPAIAGFSPALLSPWLGEGRRRRAPALQSTTVGRHIDALEIALGLKLFQRHKKGSALTQEGMWVLEQSERMQSGVHNIQRMVEGDYQQLHGSVLPGLTRGFAQ